LNAENGSNRVNRGGSWNNNAVNCRSANRNRNSPGNRNDNLGFRLLSTRLCRRRRVHGGGARAAGQVQAIIPRRVGVQSARTNNNGWRRVVGQLGFDARRWPLLHHETVEGEIFSEFGNEWARA
jgi:hypothetical protein